MFVTCYNEKVTYIISKSRTFLDNSSVIPSMQGKNMDLIQGSLHPITPIGEIVQILTKTPKIQFVH